MLSSQFFMRKCFKIMTSCFEAIKVKYILEIKREKDGSNVEEDGAKSEGPKRKRRYMRRKPKV